MKIKYVTTAKPNISNSNQTREIASTATFLTALSIVAYVQERLRAKGQDKPRLEPLSLSETVASDRQVPTPR